MRKMIFIFNPHSGKARIRNNLLEIIEIFSKADFDVTAYPTKGVGDAKQKVMEINDKEYDLITCAGGDGTLDEVVAGMMFRKERLPIGYVAAGSMNDFAYSLGISKNMLTAAEMIVNSKFMPCDVGRFNDDYFVNVVAFGIFTNVAYQTGQNMKNALGTLAYVLEGLRTLPDVKSYDVRVISDDAEFCDRFILGMVANSASAGGFKNITGKDVALDDGLFEVMLIREPKNPVETNNIISALMRKTIDRAHMYCFKTNKIRFESSESIPWTIDGEFGGSYNISEVENIIRAIEIAVP